MSFITVVTYFGIGVKVKRLLVGSVSFLQIILHKVAMSYGVT